MVKIDSGIENHVMCQVIAKTEVTKTEVSPQDIVNGEGIPQAGVVKIENRVISQETAQTATKETVQVSLQSSVNTHTEIIKTGATPQSCVKFERPAEPVLVKTEVDSHREEAVKAEVTKTEACSQN